MSESERVGSWLACRHDLPDAADSISSFAIDSQTNTAQHHINSRHTRTLEHLATSAYVSQHGINPFSNPIVKQIEMSTGSIVIPDLSRNLSFTMKK
jgi:hypothetical protein